MSNLPSVQYSPVDYETIEAAVVETERGRWFLSEYQRRNRHTDTQQVLSALERMQSTLTETVQETIAASKVNAIVEPVATDPTVDVLRLDLIEMARRIAETHNEVAAIGSQDENPQHVDMVSGELDAIVRSTEQATSEILESAEQIQEIAWTLREGGFAVETCDAIDVRATNIYLACSFQDLTAQRTTKVIETMRFLENRIHKMINILQGVEGFRISDVAAELMSERVSMGVPPAVDNVLEQNDVDFALKWDDQHANANPELFDDLFVPSDNRPEPPAFEAAAHLDVPLFGDEDAVQPIETASNQGWMTESEIADSLEPIAPVAPAKMMLVSESDPQASTQHAPAMDKMSRLEELDDEALQKKLSLFS